jgi:hypothetical protein
MTIKAEQNMRNLVVDFLQVDTDSLRQLDEVELAKMMKDQKLLLAFSCAEIRCEPDNEVEVAAIQNDMKKVALECSVCLRGLLREVTLGRHTSKHDEMVECAVSSYEKFTSLLDEACVAISPRLVSLYDAKFRTR